MATQTDRAAGVNFFAALKAPCRVATTANITLSGTQTIDDIAVVADDRVLVKDQDDATENGIYVASATAWSRAADFDGAGDVLQGTLIFVTQGTTNAATFWRQTTADDITIDTSEIAFSAFLDAATVSAFMLTLLDDASAAAARSTLGLGAWALKITGAVSKTAAYSVVTSDDGRFIKGDTSGGAFTITLPAAATAGEGFIVSVQKSDSSANVLTIDGSGSETIDGAATLKLGRQYAAVTLLCDGANWSVVSRGDAPDMLALSDGANIAWDVEAYPVARVTLGGNRTLDNPTGAKDGAVYALVVIQDGTGSRTLAYGSQYDFGDTGAPTLSTTASKRDLLVFLYYNSTMHAVAHLGFN